MPAWKPAARPLLFVSRTRWSTPWARATATVSSVEPSSITSHSTMSKPATSRGRSASVCGSCSASLKQGIWMMSFMAFDLPRLWLPAVSQSAGHGLGAKGRGRAVPCQAQVRPRLDGKRDIHPARAGHDDAGAAARPPHANLGPDRPADPVRRGAGRLPRVPDLPDLRLLLLAAVGSGPASPAPARLPGLPRTDRAPAGDRLRGPLLGLRQRR